MRISAAVLASFVLAEQGYAAVQEVGVGESIQDAIDNADPGDTILVEPGVYQEQGDSSGLYGLRIHKNDLTIKVIGPPGSSAILKPYNTDQHVGVYASPKACNDYRSTACDDIFYNFSIQGFVVEGFQRHGIQVQFVDGFHIADCTSKDNKKHGLMACYANNGGITGSTSYGTQNSGILVIESDHVKVHGNTMYGNPIGLESIVPNNMSASCNDAFNNTVGIAVLHTNFGISRGAPNNVLDVQVTHNHIYGNNLPNPGFPGQIQSELPPGIGLLIVGVKGVTMAGNTIFDNNTTGIGMAGYCDVIGVIGSTCAAIPPLNGDPAANFNTFQGNTMYNNGVYPNLPPIIPSNMDQLYLQNPAGLSGEPDKNCFQDNQSQDGEDATYFATTADGELSAGGCVESSTGAQGGKKGDKKSGKKGKKGNYVCNKNGGSSGKK